MIRKPAAPASDKAKSAAAKSEEKARKAPAKGANLTVGKPGAGKAAAAPAAPAASKAAGKGAAKARGATHEAHLTITSKNYSSWSLRGWLICRMSGLPFVEDVLPADDPTTRAELLLMSPSFLVPRLRHGEVDVWDTMAIADYLGEIFPESGLLPADIAVRAHCRAISGEMHSGFANLRAALPMNIKGRYPGFKVWAGAQADIDHIVATWKDCLNRYGGPFLFGKTKTVADAMYAPVCARFVTYDVKLDAQCAAYRDHIMALPAMQEWIAGAMLEPDELEELDVEF